MPSRTMSTIEVFPFELAVTDEPGRVIRGRLHGPQGFVTSDRGLPHLIVIHGFKGFMHWGFFPDIARRIAERGMVAVAFNMSGSGVGDDLESFSEPDAFAQNTISRELRDLDMVRAWIRAKHAPGVDPDNAALIGHSRGGGIALVHAADHAEIRSVVTWAAVASFDRFDADTKAMWRDVGALFIRNARTGQDQRIDVAHLDDLERHRARFDVEAACRRLKMPTLLIHGAADDAVPPEEMATLAANIDAGLRSTLLVAGASHTFGVRHPMRSGSLEAWDTVASATLAMIERYR
jgi:dienelactone hydrolase